MGYNKQKYKKEVAEASHLSSLRNLCDFIFLKIKSANSLSHRTPETATHATHSHAATSLTCKLAKVIGQLD